MFQQCKLCHDGKGTAGTPMGLMTYADFTAPSKTNPAMPVYKMVQTRMHDPAKPMPPTGMLPATDLSVVDSWVAAGATDCGFAQAAAAAATPATTQTGPGAAAAGAGATEGASAPVGDIAQYLSADGTYFIKPPPGNLPVGPDAKDAEFCFNLTAHGTQSPLAQDTTPFSVPASEFYHKFQFQVPYGTKMVGLSTKPITDNTTVLHHWLLFHVLSDTGQDGQHADELLGIQTGSELLSGWAPGGNPPELPPGVGEELPPPKGFMTLEFHYFNNTGKAQDDRSGARICATTKTPANVATLTWLGTESITIPPHAQGTATGNCTPGGGALTQDIHLIFASPHMHKLGSHMSTIINRKGGMAETVVDNPFSFNDQREYQLSNVVHPGDTLTTTCTWMNTTDASVGFGESTTSEMCYDFVLSYPAHSMPNPNGGGLEGSSNMCLN
jgi:Copper type II ascorbate-dependent monooxygenase, C-terminal domain